MHAFLLVDPKKEDIDKKAQEIAKCKFSSSISKISEVKKLAKQLQIKLPQNSVFVIENIDQASTEAQNAFLKLLEEPQERLSFVLTCHNKYKVLPTIVSRCWVHSYSSKMEKLKDSEFWQLNKPDQFKYVSDIKSRQEAVEFLSSLVVKDGKLSNHENVDICLSAIKNNANVNLQLTNFIVNLD